MKPLCIALLSFALSAFAQVKITHASDRISVEIDGKPFTALFVGPEVAKPYLFPLRAASGRPVTRGFPPEESPGDSKDHPHHRGLTFAHADLNGNNFWANEAFNPGVKGVKLVTDTRKMTFHSHPTMRIVDYEILLKAIETARFGDTHEGSFGVRLAACLEEPAPKHVPLAKGQEARPTEPPRTAKISDAEGRETAIFDNLSNPRYPTYFFAVSDLGNDKTRDGSLTLRTT